jgi:hypothetical protein
VIVTITDLDSSNLSSTMQFLPPLTKQAIIHPERTRRDWESKDDMQHPMAFLSINTAVFD